MSVSPDQMQSSLTETRDAGLQKLQQTPYDPSSVMGPPPQAPTPDMAPKDHFDGMMKVAPLFMALAAVGGKFARVNGIGMLKTTNEMMKGMLSGNAQAYQNASQEYDKKWQDYNDKYRTWIDTYKAYNTAYKDRIDAQYKAVEGANKAIGEQDLKADRESKLSATQVSQAEKLHAQIKHWTATEFNAAKREKIQEGMLEVARQRASTEAVKAAAQIKAALAKAGGSNDVKTMQAALNATRTRLSEIKQQWPKGTEPTPEVKAEIASINVQAKDLTSKITAQAAAERDNKFVVGQKYTSNGVTKTYKGNGVWE